jgi:hypothetical protein
MARKVPWKQASAEKETSYGRVCAMISNCGMIYLMDGIQGKTWKKGMM